ncbi:heme o synthase [Polycladidibacter stylochi]|uniref:heme o synthase n=1 Tax=Polycladidibacter stylochi TaxID=1807766 RepID=UPI00082E11DE|nr:heme o synthase [Pseudovibrio stylochi]
MQAPKAYPQVALAGQNQAEQTVSYAEASDFIALLKPRVMSLVVFTALVAIVLAPSNMPWGLQAISLMCIAIGAGASGALNMWWDADIDALMTRTQNRPIPAGRVSKQEALAFGLSLSVGSVLVLGLVANWTAAFLLAFTIFFYVAIYSIWLKRRTPQNIVIGGAAGALPPVVGWAAVTGVVSLESTLLFLIIFAWTPPHFWALALFKNKDYQRAKVPMLPVVAGVPNTCMQIVVYAVVLWPIGMAPFWAGFASPLYGLLAFVLGGIFAFKTLQLYNARHQSTMTTRAVSVFRFSLIYLSALFASLLLMALTNLGV